MSCRYCTPAVRGCTARPAALPSGVAWMDAVAWSLGGLALLVWLAPPLAALLAGWRPGSLDRVPPDGAVPPPSLSVIVAARDEAATIEPAMRSLLALDVPDFEIVAVDDRSGDGTGEALDRLAAGDPRLRVVHVGELPAGWLGKNHALGRAAAQARGEFLLFTDADVVFAPDAPARALRHMQRQGLDHLAVYPEVPGGGFWEAAGVRFFGLLFFCLTRPWSVGNPRSRAHVGVGAFNLVRAAAYRRAGGHDALPMDVADDLKLAKVLKRSGARAGVLPSGGLVRVRWVEGLGGLVRGLTKNAWAALGYRYLPAFASMILVLWMAAWPLAGLFVGPLGARLLSAAAYLVMVAMGASVRSGRSLLPLHGLVFPVLGPLYAYIILRSMIVTIANGGVRWRGTLYPLPELRRNLV